MKLLISCAFAAISAMPVMSWAQRAQILDNPVAPAGAAPAAGQPAGPLNVGQALDMLEKRGNDLNSFIADVKLSETNNDLGTEEVRSGKIWYQKLADGSARIRVSFTLVEENGKKRTEQKDYVLDGGWLTERDGVKKTNIRRQILRPGEKMNPVKLGEGPFPLPIGQKKEDVQKQFAVEKLRTKKDEPAGTTHLSLKPQDDSPLKKQFSVIDVFVDPAQRMPVRVDTTSANGKRSQTTELNNIQINPNLVNADFDLPPVEGSKWTTREEPLDK